MKILVATDGSEPATNAVEYAVSLAEKISAGLVVLHVIKMGMHEHHWVAVKHLLEKELREKGDGVLKEVKEKLSKRGIEVETVSRVGLPHEEIIKYATENDMAMVIMGAGGKDFVTRRLLGSVTEKVAKEVGRKLSCPLLITPARKGWVMRLLFL